MFFDAIKCAVLQLFTESSQRLKQCIMVKIIQATFPSQVVMFDVLLVLFCVFCERLVLLANERWMKAVIDSTIHASIAGLAWLTVTGDKLACKTIAQSILCAFMSSAIDVDHFIAASSLSLEVGQYSLIVKDICQQIVRHSFSFYAE